MRLIKKLLQRIKSPKNTSHKNENQPEIPHHDLPPSPKKTPFWKKISLPKKPQLPVDLEATKTKRKEAPQWLKKVLNYRKKKAPSLPKKSFLSRLDLEKLSQALFSVKYRPQIHQFLLLLFFLSSAYSIGKLAALLIRGKETYTAPSSPSLDFRPQNIKGQVDSIRLANLFNARQATQDPNQGQDKKQLANEELCQEAKRRSSLPLTLLHTTVLQDSVKSVAAVQQRSSSDILSLRQGEKIKNLAKIGRIERLKVILRNLSSGQCEYIANTKFQPPRSRPLKVLAPNAGQKLIQSQKPEGIANDGNKFRISRSFLQESLQDISNVLTQAKGVPITNPDGSLSFKITQVAPGGLFTHLGVGDDDIITRINGKKIKNLQEVLELFGNLKQIDNLNLTLKRNGEEKNLDYSFE